MKYKLPYILALLFATLQAFAQTYTYDSNYRLTKVTYNNGISVTYTYDALGNRLTKNVTGATAATYTINTTVTPIGSGIVTGGGTYATGTTIELNAIPNTGYEFSKWSDGITTNPRTVTVTADQSFTAQFTVSSVTPDLRGDIIVDGKINNQDLNALVDAYLSEASATDVTDLDTDGLLSIADIAQLVGIINDGNGPYNSNGHRYVDLGLPSGTLWATCNVGATKPEEFGGYYAWGEIEEKDSYSWETYKWCDGSSPSTSNYSLTKYCDRGGYGSIDGKITLELEDDVANVKWGGDWHIPTEAEILELINNCESEETTINGVSGMSFKGANGNSIFIPAAGSKRNESFSSGEGEYWSTNLGNHSTTIPYFNFYDNTIDLYERELYNTQRYRGFTIRPVLSEYTPAVHKIEAPSIYRNHDLVDLGLPSGTLWATCNIGAASPEDYGCYYAWGETEGSCEGKTAYWEESYKYYDGSAMTKYHDDGDVLETTDDVATAKWGGEWRMPTYSEISELQNTKYTSCVWTTENGVNGYRITSIVKGFEGNSIFLPAAGEYRDKTGRLFDAETKGYYWGSTLVGNTNDYADHYASFMTLNSTRISKGSTARYNGLSVRSVVSIDAINK